MNDNLKKISLLLNILCLAISIAWIITSKYEFEPIIVSIGFFMTLITIIFFPKKDKKPLKKTNTIIIESGDNNKVKMDVNNQKGHIDKENLVDINSSENELEIDKDNKNET